MTEQTVVRNQAGHIPLMPEVQGGIFQQVEEQVFYVPMVNGKPDKSYAYKQGYDRDRGGDLYAPTAAAIAAIANRAGINPVVGGNYVVAAAGVPVHPFVIAWHWTGEWGGGAIQGEADYTLDLRDWIVVSKDERVMAPRFEEAYEKARMKGAERMLAAAGINLPMGKDSRPIWGDEKTAFIEKYYAAAPEEDRKGVEAAAIRAAQAEIVQQRVHMQRKAQTGAMMAALRKMLGLKATYSVEELKRGFMVYRMRDDLERMKAVLGADNMAALSLAGAAKAFGIDPTLVAGAMKALKAGQEPAALPEPTPEAVQAAEEVKKAVDFASGQVARIAVPSAEDLPDKQPEFEEPPQEDEEAPKGQPVSTAASRTAIPVSQPVSLSPVINIPTDPTATATVAQSSGVPCPWRNNDFDDPTRKLDPKKDKALIDRAVTSFKPAKHLSNLLQKNYKASRWGEMTLEQGMNLWARMDDMMFPATEAKDVPDQDAQ